MAEKMTCAQCGMPCEAGEFHPYAACLMFTACHDSDTVRANIAQPAQAVDVDAACMSMYPDWSKYHQHERETFRKEMKQAITRAIGNAQADVPQEWRSLLANLAAVVRVQNGNLHADTNALLAHADRLLATPPQPEE